MASHSILISVNLVNIADFDISSFLLCLDSNVSNIAHLYPAEKTESIYTVVQYKLFILYLNSHHLKQLNPQIILTDKSNTKCSENVERLKAD